MKRILLSLMLLTVISMAFLLVSHTPALAGGTFSNRDLSGEYLFILTEQQGFGPPCFGAVVEHAGTLNFDGIGMVTINDTRRCTDGITVSQTTEIVTLSYSVNPDGSFLIDTAHGQILQHGRSLLIDGTANTDPSTRMFHGAAMQR